MKGKTRGKKLISILLVCMLLLGLMPTVALTAPAAYNVWLGTTQVTDDNKDSLAGGTASYDPATKTLTLNNYDGGCIKAEQELNIVLANGTTNKITVPNQTVEYGIRTKGACSLTGGGDLTIDATAQNCDGIYAQNTNWSTEDGNLTLNMTGDLIINAKDDGIDADNNINISGSGDISLVADYTIWAGYNIEISGSGKVTAIAGQHGIWSEYGTVTIGGSRDVDVSVVTGFNPRKGIRSYEDITISGSGNVSVVAKEQAILLSNSGSLILSGSGNVTAGSVNENAVYIVSDGAAVQLNGTNPSVIFETKKADKQAVCNPNTAGSPVGGTNFSDYTVTGTPGGQTVKYTRNHTHNMVKTEANSPTCTQPGNNAYWTCSDCSKVYKDEAGTQETTVAAETLAIDPANHSGTRALEHDENEHWYQWDCCHAPDGAKTAHTYTNDICDICGYDRAATPPAPTIVEGDGQEWTKGTTEDLRFKSTAEIAEFPQVMVDGTAIEASNYTVEEGSTIIILKASYLETLSVGAHKIVIVSASGAPTATFFVKAAAPGGTSGGAASPKTGDVSNAAMWGALLFVSLSGVATGIISKRRKVR